MANHFFFTTGICAEKAEIIPKSSQLFNYMSYTDLCEFRGLITKHEIKIDDMKKAYDFVINSEVACPAPNEKSIRQLKKPSKSC